MEMLSEIGTVHFDAAALALRNIRNSNDQRREVELAIGHLQAAHVAYRKQYVSLSALKRGYFHDDVFRACAHDQASNLLLCVCYCHLREKRLMEEHMRRAVECDEHLAADRPYIMGMFNPKHYVEIFVRRPWPKLLSKKELRLLSSTFARVVLET